MNRPLRWSVARILRVQPYQIAYLLNTNRVPEPQVRLGSRRAFQRQTFNGWPRG